MRPKKTVNPMTNAIANQKLNHCTDFLRSNHHCRTVFGSASSKACFNTTSRSCQKFKFRIYRSFAVIREQEMAYLSIEHLLISFRNHTTVFLSFTGNRSAIVRIVSSTKPEGNISLEISVWNQAYSKRTYLLRWRLKKETWLNILIVVSSSSI